MDIDNMINEAIGDIRKRKKDNKVNVVDKSLGVENVNSIVNSGTKDVKLTINTEEPTKIEDIYTNNVVCNTIDALGYLDMKETKKVARIIHNKVLQSDIERSRSHCKDKLSRVFKYFMKAKYGNKLCINAFSYYYIYYQGTKVSLKDLLYLEDTNKASSLGRIINVLNNINMGLGRVDTLGIRLCDIYGNSLAIKNLI